MLIKRRPDWDIPESQATPEHVFLNRREFVKAAGFVGTLMAPGAAQAQSFLDRLFANDAAKRPREPDPTADLYPAKRNEAYTLDRPVTEEKWNLTYNNFYEFGTDKGIWQSAEALKTRPWTITIDGMVEEKKTVDIDQFIRSFALEERLYRFRCVEAWSMAVPWTGIPMKDFVSWARPLGSAKYIRMETFNDPKMAPGQRAQWYPWPYVEGLTMAEATNELALLVTGAYGKPVANQMGAPLRLAVPWKYGFKSIKSIVKFTFTDQRPKGLWEDIQASEYGFWANVNPKIAHPRWSQASERVLGTSETRPTLLYNGYEAQVAEIYKGLEGEKLYM